MPVTLYTKEKGKTFLTDEEWANWGMSEIYIGQFTLHREDGPAYINDHSRYGKIQSWWINGRMHRKDGPALISLKEHSWFTYGKLLKIIPYNQLKDYLIANNYNLILALTDPIDIIRRSTEKYKEKLKGVFEMSCEKNNEKCCNCNCKPVEDTKQIDNTSTQSTPLKEVKCTWCCKTKNECTCKDPHVMDWV